MKFEKFPLDQRKIDGQQDANSAKQIDIKAILHVCWYRNQHFWLKNDGEKWSRSFEILQTPL